MSDQRRRLAIRGVIFVVLVALLFIFSRYIPRPFSAFAPPGEELDDFEGIYSSSDKLSKFLQSLGPYSPAVFVLFQIIQVIAAPFPGELTGVAGGFVYGETDEFSYNIVRDPVHIHDLNATTLHLLGVDHTRLTYRHQGRDYRLTDVHGEVVRSILT
jgi:hypothetical protein